MRGITPSRRAVALMTALLFLSPTSAAPLAIAPPWPPQCRCALMPASTPFFPPQSPAPTRTGSSSFVDSCTALGPRLQSWREAAPENAAEKASQLEAWVLDQDERTAKAAADVLWGKRPLPTGVMMKTGASGNKANAEVLEALRSGKDKGRVVCRSVIVVDEIRPADRWRGSEDASWQTTGPDQWQQGPAKTLWKDIEDALRSQKLLLPMRIVVLLLVLLCLIEVGDEIVKCFQARRGGIQDRRGGRRDEKSWLKNLPRMKLPALDPIMETDEDDTPLP
ncbi:uncharacterized protein IWZ02DRAFT_436375 [Phyllosticta citriasiana]|uniref:Uncharacterized protein n=1 Tax=Phyllosticta citriasiana TaxID=595635 RepID=A0ABR1KKC3_9PEZI